jgi:hypothetical protein
MYGAVFLLLLLLLQLRNFATSQLRNFTTSQLHNFATSHLHSFTTSYLEILQPRSPKLQDRNKMASQKSLPPISLTAAASAPTVKCTQQSPPGPDKSSQVLLRQPFTTIHLSRYAPVPRLPFGTNLSTIKDVLSPPAVTYPSSLNAPTPPCPTVDSVLLSRSLSLLTGSIRRTLSR